MKSIVAALIFLVAVSPDPSAEVLYPAAIVLEPGYASGPPAGFPWMGMYPDYGDPLVVVARVASVGEPFADLLPTGVYELTCVYEGSTCSAFGIWDNIPCSGGVFGTFHNGTVAFYLDTAPDADFAFPSTFRDGEQVLIAQLFHVHVNDDDPWIACPQVPDVPDVTALFSFAGGTWFSRVSSDGVGMQGMSEGELDGDVPAPLPALGYIFRVDGTFDVYGPVAVETTTWGRVKALYR
ncbi:MAG TPA: hypothetical protein VFT13_08760 [Candidatus Krumholzibacteria bacterium]|nr:hypothetical protein [Candidatus Krumholzibacteria bacterium]